MLQIYISLEQCDDDVMNINIRHHPAKIRIKCMKIIISAIENKLKILFVLHLGSNNISHLNSSYYIFTTDLIMSLMAILHDCDLLSVKYFLFFPETNKFNILIDIKFKLKHCILKLLSDDYKA